jgi:hypothetical protein
VAPRPGAEPLVGDLDSPPHPVRHALGHGRLEGGAQVGHIYVAERHQRLCLVPDRRLEASKGEMRLRPAEHRPRQGEAFRPAGAGRSLHRGPTGKAEAQQLGGLVEGLAQGIVDSGAEALIVADAMHHQQLGVPA